MSKGHPFEPAPSILHARAVDEQRVLSAAVWDELRTFLAVAKFKSHNRASEYLGLSHTTVTRHIRRVEDVLGTKLVVASKKGAILTEKGLDLAAGLARVDHDIFSLVTDMKSNAQDATGMVRISITDGLGLVFAVPEVARLKKDYPGIQVYLKSMSNYQALIENQTDIMIGFAPDETEETTSIRLGTLHYIPFASHTYIEARGLPNADNLAHHEFINTERYAARGGLWESWHVAVAQGRVAHICDASISYALMVKFGLGIGLLPTFNLAEPSVAPLDLGIHIALPLYAVVLSDRLASRAVKIVFDALCEVLSARNPWLGSAVRFDLKPQDTPKGYALIFNLPSSI